MKNLFTKSQIRGFTIIEVLVASTLVAIVCTGAYALLVSSGGQNTHLQEEKEIHMMLQSTKNCFLSFGSNYIKVLPKEITGSIFLGNDLMGCSLSGIPGSTMLLQRFTGNPPIPSGNHEYTAEYITSTGSSNETIAHIIVTGPSITKYFTEKVY